MLANNVLNCTFMARYCSEITIINTTSFAEGRSGEIVLDLGGSSEGEHLRSIFR